MKTWMWMWMWIGTALALSSCTMDVPTGHIGKCRSPGGFEEEILAPGLQACFGRDVMHLMEVSDRQHTIKMSVLCQDSLNFKFDVGVLVAVDASKTKLINESFRDITPAEERTITGDQLFQMYVAPVVDQEARKVVSRYATTEIVAKRAQIIEEIRAAVQEALAGSLIKIKRVTVNNLDFPDVITRAQEQKAQKRVEVDIAKAEAQRRLVEKQRQLEEAAIEYKIRLVEASQIADFNKIVGGSITREFLAWWQLRVFSDAAQGPNNWGFIPYTDLASQVISVQEATQPKNLVDEELRARVRAARMEADKPLKEEVSPQTPPAGETSNPKEKP